MGVIYTRTSRGTRLRDAVSEADRRQLIETYYQPHHRRLEEAVSLCLRRHGFCLIIDGHSFGSKPLPHEPDQDKDRPEICVGTDEFHTPPALVELAAGTY